MTKLLLILLFPVLVAASPYMACYSWVQLSTYGISSTVENYVYEAFVPLNCNGIHSLLIYKSDSTTVISNFYVVDWLDDTLHIFIKHPSITANTRDSICVIRGRLGSAGSLANTFIAGFDASTDLLATPGYSETTFENITRFAFDTTHFIPMLDTAGTIDGFRECSQIMQLPDGQFIWATSAWTGAVYDSDSSYTLLYEADSVSSKWELDSEISIWGSGTRLYSEDAFFVFFSGGDSIGKFFEDKARGGDTDQVSLVTAFTRDGISQLKWSGKTVCVGPTAVGGNNVNDFKWPGATGGKRSPSSPTVYNDGDSAFYCFVEVKADSYKFGGTKWQLGVGATYLYKATNIRGPYVRQINKSTNTAAGDTLVPIVPLETVSVPNVHDHGMIPHGLVKYGSYFYVLISGVDSTGPSTYPQTPWVGRSARLDSGWTKITGLSASDSIWNGLLAIPQQLAEVGPYALREDAATNRKVYLCKGLVFDTSAHPTAWQWFRPPLVDYLGSAIVDNGVLTMVGEQTVESGIAMVMSTGTTALGDSFEIIYRYRAVDRSGGFSTTLSIGSGDPTDYLNNAAEWNEIFLKSGTGLKFGESTSTLARHAADGTKTTFENNTVVSPASYAAWNEYRIQNRKTSDWQTSHRWTMEYSNLGKINFLKNGNGTAADWIGNANKILVSGGTPSGGGTIADLPQFDYLLARPYYDYELFAAPGITNRDSFPITKSTYIYQNATTFNYGGSARVGTGWPNGAGTTRSSSLWQTSIAALPDSAQILHAELVVFDTLRNIGTAPADSEAYIAAYKITSNWVPGSADGAYQFGSTSWLNQGHGTGVSGATIAQADSVWTTAGGDFDMIYSEVIVLNSNSDPAQYAGMKFDITEWAKIWHADSTTNFGVMLRETRSTTPSKTINQQFQTESYAMTTHRPSIIVYWAEPDVHLLKLDDGKIPWGLWDTIWNLWRNW